MYQILYSFITCAGLCIYHYSGDTEPFQYYSYHSCGPFIAPRASSCPYFLPIPSLWQLLLICLPFLKLSLQKCHTSGIIQYVAFELAFFFFLLSTSLEIHPVSVYISSSFFWLLNSIPWCVCTTVYLTIHPLQDIWADSCFGLLQVKLL